MSGELPFWDPFVGAGQAAGNDALHQMFLLPVLAIRMIGGEVAGFNLWIALPFPLAAAGAWLFLAKRFSGPASTLGALAFALGGPIVSTGNFPNMSWSVAAMPWVLWSVDRVAASFSTRRVAVLALATAFQALAGEPVTFTATSALAVSFAFFVAISDATLGQRIRCAVWTAAGLVLGAAVAAVQLVPMIHAATVAERSKVIVTGVWSLHPMALLETIAQRFYGDFFAIQSLSAAPWLALVNTGREPFFFSLYFGVPLLALALLGLVSLARSSWGMFWAAAGGTSIVLAFGVYTPVYPFLRDHIPVLAAFRFPVKYLVVFSMAVAAGAAAGWDALNRNGVVRDGHSVFDRARVYAVGVALLIGAIAGALAVAAIYFPEPTAVRASSLARAVGATGRVDVAGQFMVRALPRLGIIVAPIAIAASVLLFLSTSAHASARLARQVLFVFIAGDLLIRAWGLNPVLDVRHFAEPEWLSRTKADANARFYVGGKKDGTLDAWDSDSSRGFLNAPGLVGSASRAALSGQTAFYPSAWRGREMLSFDLAILWPKLFEIVTERFFESDRTARDLFLDRTGVRYRVLPHRLSAGHAPLVRVPYYSESFLYDWGPGVAQRTSVVADARIVPEVPRQIDALFEAGWDTRSMVILDRELPAAGTAGQGVAPFARIVSDGSNRVVVEAGAPGGGGYLVLLDSYSDDWRVSVDGRPATAARANALFRAVRLTAGHHTIDFVYRPRVLLWGTAVSGLAVLCLVGLVFAPSARRVS